MMKLTYVKDRWTDRQINRSTNRLMYQQMDFEERDKRPGIKAYCEEMEVQNT
jgi:hypothetical protein